MAILGKGLVVDAISSLHPVMRFHVPFVNPVKGNGGDEMVVVHGTTTGSDVPLFTIGAGLSANLIVDEEHGATRDDGGDTSIHYVVARNGHAVKPIDEHWGAFHAQPGIWERERLPSVRSVGVEVLNRAVVVAALSVLSCGVFGCGPAKGPAPPDTVVIARMPQPPPSSPSVVLWDAVRLDGPSNVALDATLAEPSVCGGGDAEGLATTPWLRPAMWPPRRALRKAAPLARAVVAALRSAEFGAVAAEVHPARPLCVRPGAAADCVTLTAAALERCGTAPGLLSWPGAEPLTCARLLAEHVAPEPFDTIISVTANCPHVLEYNLAEAALSDTPTPLLIQVRPQGQPFPEQVLTVGFQADGDRLWLTELWPAGY